MTNILLGAILAVLGLSLWRSWAQSRRYQKIYADLRDSFTAFLSPAEDGKASALATMTDAAAQMIARAMAMQIKAMLMGMQSGQVRGEKAEQGEMALEQLQGSPLAALGNYAGIRRSLRKNPGLMDLALQFLPGILAGKGGQGAGPGGSGDNGAGAGAVRFKL